MKASHHSQPQSGIALITVMAALLMCIAVVLASARTALLHEIVTGNDSDQMRARAAAEALIQDAEADIRGLRADGSPCRPASNGSSATANGFVGCRERGSATQATAPWFPRDLDDLEQLAALLNDGTELPCRDGICAPSTLAALDHIEDQLDKATAAAATYGQFTRDASPGAGTAANPVLVSSPPRSWYWVEAFQYETGRDAMANGSPASPDPTRPFVYRITAVALGLKPGTKAVLKSYFVPYPSGQLQ